MLVLHDPHEPAMSRSTPRRRGGCSSASWRRGRLALVRGRRSACTMVEQPQQLLRQPTAARAVPWTRCGGGVFVVVAAWWWSYGWCRRRPRQTASCRLGPVPTRLVLIHSVVCTATTATAVIVVVRDVVQRHALTAHTITSSNILSARAPSIIPSQYTQ